MYKVHNMFLEGELCSQPHPRMVARGKQSEPLMAEMCNNLQVKIYYFNTAHSKFEMLLIIFILCTPSMKFLSSLNFVH